MPLLEPLLLLALTQLRRRFLLYKSKKKVPQVKSASKAFVTNLDELLAACERWTPAEGTAARLRVACVAVSFRSGLVASAPAIRRTDVLVGPHGADMTNALGMHAGASVLELVPLAQVPRGIEPLAMAAFARSSHTRSGASAAERHEPQCGS